jgi:hypothetical protein
MTVIVKRVLKEMNRFKLFYFLDQIIFLEFFKSKVKVEIRVVFLKIGEIDTIKEQFQAEAFIECKWKEPSFKIQVKLKES